MRSKEFLCGYRCGRAIAIGRVRFGRNIDPDPMEVESE